MIDFTSFGKLFPDSVQLHYSLSKVSLQLPYSLNSYRSLYPQDDPHGATKEQEQEKVAVEVRRDGAAAAQFGDVVEEEEERKEHLEARKRHLKNLTASGNRMLPVKLKSLKK